MVERRPFGSWPSPLTAAALVSGATSVSEVVVDGSGRGAAVWFVEARPNEGGRNAVMRIGPDGTTTEVTPTDANVRSRVHEYGGGAWWAQDDRLFYVDMADQQLRSLDVGGTPTQLTHDERDRYADLRASPDGRWVVAVRERHDPARPEAVNEIVAVASDGSGTAHPLVTGVDFVSNPRLSPDGTTLAWLQWCHPDMPWDTTQLWTAAFDDGQVNGAVCVARDAALVQPEWSPAGVLHVVTDQSGWWRIVSAHDGTELTGGERDWVEPPWVFGGSSYAFADDGTLLTAADVSDVLSEVSCVRARGNSLVAAGASWSQESQVVERHPDGTTSTLRPARTLDIDDRWFPAPEHLTFPTGTARQAGTDRQGAVAHAWFYAPANPEFAGTEGERPPLIVMAHGGPTSAARTSLRLATRYWTSRGFAVVDVDYRGSTGYGRAYRRQLDGQWGIADVQDCIAAAQYLADQGAVDADRLLIRGGSAGGFTVLLALTMSDVFAGGASHYGVADLEALATDTHKFESRYLDRLVGPYPEAKDRYVERSPIHHMDKLDTPMIILQGLDDRVVPPNQAEMMVAALDSRRVPHAYVAFEGEGHGFRKAENMIAAIEAELSFYAQLLGFDPADDIVPVALRGRAS